MKGIPPLILRFRNISDVVLFTVHIETEPDNQSDKYHGLTVRCEYNGEPQDSRYEVGVVPYSAVHMPTLHKPGGRTIYRC